MIDELHISRRFGPWFWKQPDPAPQSALVQLPTQPTRAQPQHAYDSSPSTRCTAVSGRHRLGRRSETRGLYAQVVGVFYPGPIRQRPKRRHRQCKPVPRHTFGVGPPSVLPLPSKSLERSEAQLYPEPKHVPAHSRFVRLQIGHHHPTALPGRCPRPRSPFHDGVCSVS